MPSRTSPLATPYKGRSSKIILAFDIGTTYSGVSFCRLEPGIVPQIKCVTRFPGQDSYSGDTKIPSVVWYNRDGDVMAVGAEATQDETRREAYDNSWCLAELWKLHLRPDEDVLKQADRTRPIPDLPEHKTALDVLSDFIQYLYRCAKTYLTDVSGNMSALDGVVEVILTHPNNWQDAVQKRLRQATVLAGVISDNEDGHARLHLLTEGEAGLHHCVHNLEFRLPADMKTMLVADLGGGTIDLSAYTTSRNVKISSTARFQEVAIPQSILAGSMYVTQSFKNHLRKHFAGTRHEGAIDQIAQEFDKKVKPRFRNKDQIFYISFTSHTENDDNLDISRGQLKVKGDVIEKTFKVLSNFILKGLDKQIKEANKRSQKAVQAVFLVGGFAGNDWLYDRIKLHLGRQKITVFRPETHAADSNKATANGAVAYYLDNFVTSRVARWTYGTALDIEYNDSNSEHRLRRTQGLSHVDLSGRRNLKHGFGIILPKYTKVSQRNRDFKITIAREGISRSELDSIPVKILAYQGEDPQPKWTDIDHDKFRVVGKIQADTSSLVQTIQPLQGPFGDYFEIEFDVVVNFGLTELKASVEWLEQVRT